ncbi:ferritin-like domain-containing protein [Streptomyces sp. NPDC004244]|uniref:ferritin-like domain-containing protein n=1 Tax=Streptomyces sp. NPDC101206 TaxID=3366128 RepID=UPI00381974E9
MITALELDAQGFGRPETLPELHKYLQAALEVEHLTIPVYMTGLYTIRPGTNRTAYYAIRAVLVEEMLHMTLVANLLNAVGGTPKVGTGFVAGYPAKLPFSGDSVPSIGLQHFSPAALRTFLRIEQPREMTANAARGSGWTSIGQFYAAILSGLEHLVEQLGHDKVFPQAKPGHQVGPEDFYNSGGEVFAVHDLATARAAIKTISEQGEGVGDTIWNSNDRLFGEQRELAHYFRFNEIYTGRSYGPHDRPHDQPSGPLIDVTWDDAQPIHGDSKVADYERFAGTSAVYDRAVAFNSRYAVLLGYLGSAFNGHPRHMALAIPTMLELRDRAEQLYRNPHPDPAHAARGRFASATFELAQQQFDAAGEEVERNVRAAALEAGEPIDLSALASGSGEAFV